MKWAVFTFWTAPHVTQRETITLYHERFPRRVTQGCPGHGMSHLWTLSFGVMWKSMFTNGPRSSTEHHIQRHQFTTCDIVTIPSPSGYENILISTQIKLYFVCTFLKIDLFYYISALYALEGPICCHINFCQIAVHKETVRPWWNITSF